MRALLILLVLVLPQTGYACRCASSPDPVRAVESSAPGADLIFVGNVLKQRMLQPVRKHAELQESQLSVASAWKGNVGETVTLVIDIQCCICGMHLVLNRDYLIFAYQNEVNTTYTANICSSRPLEESSGHIDALNQMFPDGASDRVVDSRDTED